MTEQLDNLVHGLALVRANQAKAKAKIKKMLDDTKAQDIYIRAERWELESALKIEELTEEIRKAAMFEYSMLGDKNPHEAVKIKVINTNFYFFEKVFIDTDLSKFA